MVADDPNLDTAPGTSEILQIQSSRPQVADYCDAYYLHEITARNTYVSTFFWSQLRVSTLLGVGAFGNVRKGENALPGVPKDVVVKELCSAKVIKGEVDSFLLDIDRSAGYVHPNVAQVYGATFYGPLALVMEYFPLGDLKTYMKIRSSEGASCTTSEKHSYAFQIANGMNYLHKADCIHRNLSCANVMVSEPISNTFGVHCLKIADASLNRAENSLLRNAGRLSDLSVTMDVFLQDTNQPIFTRRLSTESWDSSGISLRVFQFQGDQGIVKLVIHKDADDEAVDLTDRVAIIPPEVVEGGEYTRKSDVWAYGLLLWEILTDGRTNVVTADEPLELQSNFATLLRTLCKCLTTDPQLRPEFFGLSSSTATAYIAIADETILKYDLHNQVHLQRDKAYIPRSLLKISAKACAAGMTVRPPSTVVLNASTRDHSGDIPIMIQPTEGWSEPKEDGIITKGDPKPCLSTRVICIWLGVSILLLCLVAIATALALTLQSKQDDYTASLSKTNDDATDGSQSETSLTNPISWDPPATSTSSTPTSTDPIASDFVKTFAIRTLNESVFGVDLRDAACFNGVYFDSCGESARVLYRWVDFNLLAPNDTPTRCVTQQNATSAGCLQDSVTTECYSYIGSTVVAEGIGCEGARERFVVQRVGNAIDPAGVRLYDDVSELCAVYTSGTQIGLDLADCDSPAVAILVLDSF